MNSSERGGGATVHFEPPDTALVAYSGVVDGACVRASREKGGTLVKGLEYYFLIFDVTAMVGMTPDGRSAIVAPAAPGVPPVRAIAVIGTNFHIRSIMSMVVRARYLLVGRPEKNTGFFDTAAEARAWLAEQRR